MYQAKLTTAVKAKFVAIGHGGLWARPTLPSGKVSTSTNLDGWPLERCVIIRSKSHHRPDYDTPVDSFVKLDMNARSVEVFRVPNSRVSEAFRKFNGMGLALRKGVEAKS